MIARKPTRGRKTCPVKGGEKQIAPQQCGKPDNLLAGLNDPDACLMLRVRQGDVEAFGELVDRYYDRVVFVVTHLMGHPRQSEDLAQDVFLRVYRARLNYRPESKFSTWLFVIVNNVVRNARRSLARRREQAFCHEDDRPGWPVRLRMDCRAASPLDATETGELRATVREAIGELNARQQQAVMLYHFEGLSYTEIADAMDTSLCAAKALLHRARLALRGHLEEYASA